MDVRWCVKSVGLQALRPGPGENDREAAVLNHGLLPPYEGVSFYSNDSHTFLCFEIIGGIC